MRTQDTSGRVHETDRLSVIDASIVPNGPAAFTHIPTVMIAEHLSEQIASAIQQIRTARTLPVSSAR